MVKFIEKIKNFFSGKFTCKSKKKPVREKAEQELPLQEEKPEVGEKSEEQK